MDFRITTANEASAPRFARYRYRHGENAVQGGQTPTQGPGDNGNKKKEAPKSRDITGTMSRDFGAFTKHPDQLYQIRGYTPVTPGSSSGYTTVVKQMPRAGTSS